MFYKGKVIYALYTDDLIIVGHEGREVEAAVEDIKRAGLDITIEGTLEDFLGVNIERRRDGSIHLTQPHLIDSILKDLKLDGDDVKIKTTPTTSTRLLSFHSTLSKFDKLFHYHSIISKLNFLEKSTCPDIACITHQCARYSTDPRKERGAVICWIVQYLKGTRDNGIIMQPMRGRELEIYVDADFVGSCDRKESDKRDTARSRHSYVLMYGG